MNGWVEQLASTSPRTRPRPRARWPRCLTKPICSTANWPGTNPYDEFILENIAARMLARVVADTFGADRSGNYRELLALVATLVLIARPLGWHR